MSNPIPRPDLPWYQVAWILSMTTDVQQLLGWRSTFIPVELAPGLRRNQPLKYAQLFYNRLTNF